MRALVFLMGMLLFSIAEGFDHAKMLRENLSYLQQIPEVEWVEFERNMVFIGWKKLPPEFVAVNHEAALNGYKAIGFGVHVWSVMAEHKRWRPGEAPYLCETTAREGRISHSSCK